MYPNVSCLNSTVIVHQNRGKITIRIIGDALGWYNFHKLCCWVSFGQIFKTLQKHPALWESAINTQGLEKIYTETNLHHSIKQELPIFVEQHNNPHILWSLWNFPNKIGSWNWNHWTKLCYLSCFPHLNQPLLPNTIKMKQHLLIATDWIVSSDRISGMWDVKRIKGHRSCSESKE